uniref:Uncharacterized protein n=1 Tax=Anopheles atroparvus TaxID=41427 RepID=A0A182JMJ5_ANOAO
MRKGVNTLRKGSKQAAPLTRKSPAGVHELGGVPESAGAYSDRLFNEGVSMQREDPQGIRFNKVTLDPLDPDGASEEGNEIGRFLDEVRSLLADHDDRRVDVAAGDPRHNAGVDHPQSLDAVDAQLRIDDGPWVVRRAHLGRAGHVVDRHRVLSDRAVPVLVGELGQMTAVRHLLAVEPSAEALHGLRLAKRNRRLDALAQHANVVRMREIVMVEQRIAQRVARLQPDEPTALRAQHHREHTEHVLNSSLSPCAFFTWSPPSDGVEALVSMNSMSGQSSVWFAYLVLMNPTASSPMLLVSGPSSVMAYRRAEFRFTSRFMMVEIGWSMRNTSPPTAM